ncbi:lipase/esteras-like protein [Aspergillus leporis]|uniref:Lipase/esteras-like protein n=1 Tax=Aspergillus leporis TaxID=41062 RepID=A0A5N5WK17_9EURO|nr:lipase/esteras-like protein [Aspergillus leporis]
MERLIAESWFKVENAIGQRPQLTGDVYAMRAQYKALADQANATRIISPNVTVDDRKITPQLTVRIYMPTVGHADTCPLPVGLYFHGGGLCCGDLDSEDTFCRQVAERLPCVIVSVGYRLAPEYKAPAQLHDAVEAWNWAYMNATALNGDRKRYFVAGQSAGGALVLTLMRRLISLGRRDEVNGVAAIVPFALHPDAVPSRYVDRYRAFEECADGPVNTKQAMSRLYEAIGAQPTEPDVYILNAESELHQFPPTYLAVCEIDPIRDDGLILHDRLKASGVPVQLEYYRGLPHVFWAFGCPAPSSDFVGDVVEGIKNFTHS